jgi:hypothetical protein
VAFFAGIGNTPDGWGNDYFDDEYQVKTPLLSHLYIKPIILPRQARDKHRGS